MDKVVLRPGPSQVDDHFRGVTEMVCTPQRSYRRYTVRDKGNSKRSAESAR